jgi:hypothetical protein
LWENAYPYANPLVSKDGEMLIYLSDMDSESVWDTQVNYAIKNASGGYDAKGTVAGAVYSAGYGDTNISFDGNKDFAAATWVRLNQKPVTEGTETVDNQLMLNSSEIFASIYKDGAWTTQRLTTNQIPDLAPVIATNGEKAVAVWRCVFVPDPTKPGSFDGNDVIVYSIFDGTSWSTEKALYNGMNTGSVVGLNTSMMEDGTAAVTYVFDKEGQSDSKDYEISCAVIDNNGNVVNNVRLTNDTTADENPQISTVKFTETDERFIAAWHKATSDCSDVRLAAFDNLNIYPGATKTVVVGYDVPENIVDLSYEGVNAAFSDESETALEGQGTLMLVNGTFDFSLSCNQACIGTASLQGH